MPNPFNYQRPLRPEAVIDRKSEVQRLRDGCYSGTMFLIDGPPRYGKTTLVNKLFADTAKDGTVGVLVDLRGVIKLSDITVRLGRAYSQLRGPMSSAIHKALEVIEAGFGINILGSGVTLGSRTPNEEGALLALLDLPNQLVTGRGKGRIKHVIVCFDEFQDVLQIEAADDKIRSVIQHHDEAVTYIFTGSKRRLMNQLFTSSGRAFFRQAERLVLSPLDPLDISKYIPAQFEAEASGKTIGGALAPLVSAADGHPQRVMYLANKVWSHTPEGGAAGLDIWQTAFCEVMLQEESALDGLYGGLAILEKKTLMAIALHDGRPFRKTAYEDVQMLRNSVLAAVTKLKEDGVIYQMEKGRFACVDPLLNIYVQNLRSDHRIDVLRPQ